MNKFKDQSPQINNNKSHKGLEVIFRYLSENKLTNKFKEQELLLICGQALLLNFEF